MGLILPRNPFVYPGVQPGLNRAHPASNGTRLSLVAGATSATPIIVPPSGKLNNFATPSFGIAGRIGPFMNITSGVIYTAAPNEKPDSFTTAAIYYNLNNISTSLMFNNNAGDNTHNGVSLGFNNGTPACWNNGTLLVNSNLGAPSPDFFFVAASGNSSICNFVIRSLFANNLFGATIAQASTFGTTVNSQYNVGEAPVDLAALMYGINNFLSLPELMKWAAAPWDFWYPQIVGQALFLGLKLSATSSPAAGAADGAATVAGVGASLFKAVGNADGSASVTGNDAVLAAGTGEADGSATVAGVGNEKVAGVGEADGSASVAGVSASLTGSSGEADGSSTVAGVGTALIPAAGHADGSSTVTGNDASLTMAAGHADGSATVAGVGIAMSGQRGSGSASLMVGL